MASVKKQNFQGEVYSTGSIFYFWLPLTVLSSAPAMQQGPWVADRSGEMNDRQTSWRVSLHRVCLLFPCQPRASLTQRQQTAEDTGHFIQPSFWFFLVPSQHDISLIQYPRPFNSILNLTWYKRLRNYLKSYVRFLRETSRTPILKKIVRADLGFIEKTFFPWVFKPLECFI